MKTDTDVSAEASAPEVTRAFADMRLIRALLVGIFIFTAVYALYFARDFFMPVILAFMLALMLTPIVRTLRKRGVPEALSATLLVLGSVAVISAIGYFISGPVIALVNDAPTIGRQLSERLAELRHPFDRFLEISNQVDKVAETAQEPGVQKVVVAQPGIVSQAAGNLLSAGTTIAITFVL
jgi:predicted PurR-regulated permease PerM